LFFVGKHFYEDYQYKRVIANNKIQECANPKIKKYIDPKTAVGICEITLGLKYTGKYN